MLKKIDIVKTARYKSDDIHRIEKFLKYQGIYCRILKDPLYDKDELHIDFKDLSRLEQGFCKLYFNHIVADINYIIVYQQKGEENE